MNTSDFIGVIILLGFFIAIFQLLTPSQETGTTNLSAREYCESLGGTVEFVGNGLFAVPIASCYLKQDDQVYAYRMIKIKDNWELIKQ